VNLLAISFSSNVPVSAGKVLFWPIDFTLESYKYIFANNKFIRAFGISILRVILGVGINLLLCILTAYPLSRSKNKMTGRDLYMGYFVLTMIIGGGLIPTYIIMMKLHLLNTIWALVLPGALPVWNMIILMNFIRQLPQELEDAAMIDGAGPAGTLRLILLPLLKPALATIGLFCVVGHWNDWFSGLIYMRDPANYPLQTYLQTILRTFEQILREAGRSQDYLFMPHSSTYTRTRFSSGVSAICFKNYSRSSSGFSEYVKVSFYALYQVFLTFYVRTDDKH
jgi:putative aldouronate transport system permease protein